jgi:hypothetical protein
MVKSKKSKATIATKESAEPILTKTGGTKNIHDHVHRREKLLLSKTVGGNISQSPLEFTKDSK